MYAVKVRKNPPFNTKDLVYHESYSLDYIGNFNLCLANVLKISQELQKNTSINLLIIII